MAFEVVLVENKLRPLIFGNIFRNIQKLKNGLRPSSVNYVDSFPRGGSLGTRKNLKNYKEIFYAG